MYRILGFVLGLALSLYANAQSSESKSISYNRDDFDLGLVTLSHMIRQGID